jgi:hypothetical protein
VPRTVNLERLVAPTCGKTPFERANELVLRVSCVSEAFAGGTATVTLSHLSHPLPRAVYESILRDEAHHRRLGGLYLEWALPRIDEAELARLSGILLVVMKEFSRFWKLPAGPSTPAKPGVPEEELHALGWLPASRFAEVARDVAVADILDPLATIGIAIPAAERAVLVG